MSGNSRFFYSAIGVFVMIYRREVLDKRLILICNKVLTDILYDFHRKASENARCAPHIKGSGTDSPVCQLFFLTVGSVLCIAGWSLIRNILCSFSERKDHMKKLKIRILSTVTALAAAAAGIGMMSDIGASADGEVEVSIWGALKPAVEAPQGGGEEVFQKRAQERKRRDIVLSGIQKK